MPAAAASEHADLAFHVLALIPLAGPARIFGPQYVEWVRTTMPPEAWEPILEDAGVIAELHARDPHALRLHGLPALHETIAEMRACATRDLATLGPGDVANAGVLEGMRAADATMVELVRAGMALVAGAFADARERMREEIAAACAQVDGVLADAVGVDEGIAGAKIELAIALGAAGRAIADRIFAGCPLGWNGMAAELPVVIALHERAVVRAGRALPKGLDDRERYVRGESAALEDLDERITRAPVSLRKEHNGWRKSLDVTSLVSQGP